LEQSKEPQDEDKEKGVKQEEENDKDKGKQKEKEHEQEAQEVHQEGKVSSEASEPSNLSHAYSNPALEDPAPKIVTHLPVRQRSVAIKANELQKNALNSRQSSLSFFLTTHSKRVSNFPF